MISNKLYPVCKKILKDFRALLRLMLNARFVAHELKNPARLDKAMATLLQELGQPPRFKRALAILLRPKQCEEEQDPEVLAAQEAFEKMNKKTVAKFF